MLMDVFSIFDPYEFTPIFYNFLCVVVIMTPMFLLMAFNFIWKNKYGVSFIFYLPFIMMMNQCKRSKSSKIKGMSIIIMTLFFMIISINLSGLISFSFSLSSHLFFTLLMSLPLWLSLIISSFLKKKKQFIAHLLPDGAPEWLNPFLIIIETVSIMVRPLTLAFRLAANMTAGHVVLSLMNLYLSLLMNKLNLNNMVLMIISSFYLLFEMMICLIQAYIFCLLLTLYCDDHT
uniref:ATP synthase F0 subunit 6 n=1 Tax=Haemadipsa yanyuanensis TaxID=2870508 RepID=UPI0023D84ABE|nr:ATP synthase F0 subunit 6 [Haemadipsa yanyuanensis]WDA96163.1 ATP synthase F0 subunit 6 [Haemadipsa yanyuanensis]